MPRFSTAYTITKGAVDDWFDPVLELDTHLSVDPFLISEDHDPFWTAAHGRLIDFFNEVLKLIARSAGRRGSPHWDKAARLLSFPEPAEFALGYSKNGIFGAGTGAGLARPMLDAANAAVQAGIRQIDRFEEIELFGEAIGADRIGDLVCNVLKEEFTVYTQTIADGHHLPTEPLPVRHAAWDKTNLRWVDREVALPRNTAWSRRHAVLLTPERFLRHLPTFDPSAFWDWAWSNHNEQLRRDFSYQIGQRVNRREIARLAQRHRNLWRQYLASLPKQPYDVAIDPDFRVQLYDGSRQLAAQITPRALTEPAEFRDFVADLLTKFKWMVEDRGGWELLWAGDKPRNEWLVQRLLLQTVTLTCADHGIDVTAEAGTGRGPVDFKFSTGWSCRALVEVKLAASGSLRRNVQYQLPQYLRSEGVSVGFVVIIQYHHADLRPEVVDQVRQLCQEVASEREMTYEPVFIDVRRDKPSASRLFSKREG